MEVIIEKAQLLAFDACGAYLKSPEWDAEREALVYSDWAATVDRLTATRDGVGLLGWLVARKLVPMTRAEFVKARRNARSNLRNAPEDPEEG
jgi:hypothetical protein